MTTMLLRKRSTILVVLIEAICVGVGGAQANDKPPLPTDPGAVSDAEFHLPLDEETARRVDTLIPLLRSSEYHNREWATTELIEIGAPAFSKLRDAYRATDDLEVLLRIEKIVMTSYLNRHVYHRFGFLGIRKNRKPAPTHQDDARIPDGNIGLVVELVIEDTGAAAAGLKPGDIIIALNGDYLEGGDTEAWLSFAQTIRESGGGTVVSLTILRGDVEKRIDATLGGAPRDGLNQITGMREMYAAANGNFEIWWFKYFRTVDAKSASDD